MVAMVDRSAIAHLLRRTGFGPTPAEVDAATAAGFEATVDRLVDFSRPDAAPAYRPLAQRALTPQQRQAMNRQRAGELVALQEWWLDRMATTAVQLREKLTWFWHGHFATSFDKVRLAELMYRQNELFRTVGAGDFEVLTQAVAKDPAMMIWLDTRTDKAAHPNENFARECMELFTLGIGNYTEDDVRSAARAFTGWTIDPATLTWVERPRQHDAGLKSVLGQTGAWDGEDVVHILVNSPASHAWIVSRVWSHFAYPVRPNDPLVAGLVPVYAGSGRSISALVRAVLLHPEFVSTQARTGLVKQPVEWMVGALRALGVSASQARVVAGLTALGQTPFRPPNVGGWPQNGYWLTTASSLARLHVAAVLARAGDISLVTDAAVGDRVDAAAHLLSVTWSPTTAAALARVAAHPVALVTLALVAPEAVLA
jgi:uncharacterized protein (DUF1800 family)